MTFNPEPQLRIPLLFPVLSDLFYRFSEHIVTSIATFLLIHNNISLGLQVIFGLPAGVLSVFLVPLWSLNDLRPAPVLFLVSCFYKSPEYFAAAQV